MSNKSYNITFKDSQFNTDNVLKLNKEKLVEASFLGKVWRWLCCSYRKTEVQKVVRFVENNFSTLPIAFVTLR